MIGKSLKRVQTNNDIPVQYVTRKATLYAFSKCFFNAEIRLKKHIENIHKVKKKKKIIKCFICDGGFKQKSRIESHMIGTCE